MQHTAAPIVIAWLLWAVLAYGRADDTGKASHPKASSGTGLYLHYGQGCIDAQIAAVPLRQMLSELSSKTGLKTHLSDPRIGDYPVISALETVPLTEAIKRLLDGFSYAMYAEGNMLTLSVLSTQPNANRSLTATCAIAQIPSLQGIIPTDPKSAGAPAVAGPSSLEEFEPITMEEAVTGSDEGEDMDTAPSTQQQDNQTYSEAVLQRALNALRSEFNDLHSLAIQELADLEDPRATQALVEAALNSADQPPQFRQQAVTALQQHVTALPAADTILVSALRQLAQDPDQEVRNIANQTLQAMPRAGATTSVR